MTAKSLYGNEADGSIIESHVHGARLSFDGLNMAASGAGERRECMRGKPRPPAIPDVARLRGGLRRAERGAMLDAAGGR